LSARNLNPSIEIIARGDAVSTERKLLHAGADKVVLPTHIGAERIAEIILFPETSRFIRESDRMQELERTLRNLGLAIEVVVVPESGALTDLTVEDIEMRARRLFRRAAEPSRRRSHHRARQGAARGSGRRSGGRRAEWPVNQRHVRRSAGADTRRAHDVLSGVCSPPPRPAQVAGPHLSSGAAPR
jgi:hypothetical protein